MALLEGKEIYKHYDYNPPGWDVEKAKQYYRADLSANVWWPSELSEEKLQELYGKLTRPARGGQRCPARTLGGGRTC